MRYRRLLCLFTFAFLFLSLACSAISFALAGGQPSKTAPRKSPPVGKPLDLMLLIDQSGSMKTTDPSNIRVPASQFLADYLASIRTSYFDNKMGVVNFGSTTPDQNCIAPTGLNQSGLQRVKEQIAPMDLGNTNVQLAFEKTKLLYDASKSDTKKPRKKVIVLFTDGEPDIGNGTPPQQLFPEIISYYNNNLSDVQLYVIGVDQTNQFWPKDVPYWSQIAPGRTFQLTTFDETELKKTFADIAALSFSDEKFTWSDAAEADITVEPYLESMNVVLLKDNPDAQIEVTDLNGKKFDKTSSATKDDSAGITIMSFSDPEPGKWHSKVTGKGRATIGFNKIPIKVRLEFPQPDLTYPEGRVFNIFATFQKLDGSEVRELPGVPLFPGATVTKPDGTSMDIKLNRVGTSMYESKEVIQTDQVGSYRIRLYLKGGSTLSETISNLNVETRPYVIIDPPPAHPKAGDKYRLTAKISLSGKRLPDSKSVFPSEDPRSIMFVVPAPIPEGTDIVQGKGYFMEPDSSGLYSSPDFVLQKAGSYRFTVELKGRDTTGVIFSGIPETLEFDVSTNASPWPYVFGFLGLVIVGFLGYGTWYVRGPEIPGHISVTYKSEPIIEEMRIPWRHRSFGIKCALPFEAKQSGSTEVKDKTRKKTGARLDLDEPLMLDVGASETLSEPDSLDDRQRPADSESSGVSVKRVKIGRITARKTRIEDFQESESIEGIELTLTIDLPEIEAAGSEPVTFVRGDEVSAEVESQGLLLMYSS